MVTVNMTQKTCERVVLPLDLAKVVNLYEVSNAVAKAFETDFECQGTLGIREPVRLKDDGTIRTLYDSFECRHAAVFESFKALVGVHQKARSFQLCC